MASKIYISAVRFTMLLHPPTKDLSCLLTYQVSIAPFSSAIQYHPNPLVGAHAVLCVKPFNHTTYYCHRIMRVLNFSLIVVLSCIAMISAAPVEDSARVKDFPPNLMYVTLTTVEVST